MANNSWRFGSRWWYMERQSQTLEKLDSDKFGQRQIRSKNASGYDADRIWCGPNIKILKHKPDLKAKCSLDN